MTAFGPFPYWLRESLGNEVPILVVTGRSDEEDVCTALRLGADDYVVKPPRMSELLARCEVLLRRAGRRLASPVSPPQADLAPYAIDRANRRILLEERPVALTDKEYELAVQLFEKVGTLQSRETLMKVVWKHAVELDTRTVDTMSAACGANWTSSRGAAGRLLRCMATATVLNGWKPGMTPPPQPRARQKAFNPCPNKLQLRLKCLRMSKATLPLATIWPASKPSVKKGA